MPENKTITIKRDKILCLLSGGLESLGALFVVLKDPAFQNRKIHVHHVGLKTKQNEGLVEKVSCERIVSYLKSDGYKGLECSESLHDVSFLDRHQVEPSLIAGFMAANLVINDLSISAVVFGSSLDSAQHVAGVKKLNQTRSLFQSMLMEDLRYSTGFITPTAHMSKLQIWKMLPLELRKLTWVCEQPVYKKKQVFMCQKCQSCVDFQKLIKAEAQSEWAHPLGLG